MAASHAGALRGRGRGRIDLQPAGGSSAAVVRGDVECQPIPVTFGSQCSRAADLVITTGASPHLTLAHLHQDKFCTALKHTELGCVFTTSLMTGISTAG